MLKRQRDKEVADIPSAILSNAFTSLDLPVRKLIVGGLNFIMDSVTPPDILIDNATNFGVPNLPQVIDKVKSQPVTIYRIPIKEDSWYLRIG